MKLSRLLAAAALLVGAAAPAVITAPAHAAGCTGADGITVVVDFAELGGGVTAGCADVADGTRATAAIQAAGYGTTMATRSPGFLCRVNGLPASDPCVVASPADAYWSVWWADGDGGSWVYSARGVDSLRVPDGGYMALSWHQGPGRSQPPATVPVSREPQVTKPAAPTSAPKATKTPTPKATEKASGKATATPSAEATSKPASTPSSKASAQTSTGTAPSVPDVTAAPSGTPSTSPSSEPSASADASAEAAAEAGATPAATPSPGESVSVDPSLLPADQISAGPESVSVEASFEADGGLPVWVPIVLIVAVAGVGGAVVVRRRKAQA